MPTLGECAYSGIYAINKRCVELWWQRESHQRCRGCSRHRGNVVQTAGKRFVTDLLWWRIFGEVHAFDHGIGFEEHLSICKSKVQDGAIIARAHNERGVGGQMLRKALDQFKFVHGTIGSNRADRAA